MAIQARRDVFQAIADPTRRQIMGLVARERMNLNAIADNFEMSRPAISQHIKILMECGLLNIKQQGRERYCEVELKPLTEVADWMQPFIQMWEQRFDRLDDVLNQMKTDKKSKK
ncbi:MAG: metalloregulator ArsR/SmtB family transcription factor [Mucilaginibacter sp.]|uniref:ArsR/SmtB family transcription factor n=1 Tax=Mucilaginibacter sp. TaxID=1882438 RepID=UPI0032662219